MLVDKIVDFVGFLYLRNEVLKKNLNGNSTNVKDLSQFLNI